MSEFFNDTFGQPAGLPTFDQINDEANDVNEIDFELEKNYDERTQRNLDREYDRYVREFNSTADRSRRMSTSNHTDAEWDEEHGKALTKEQWMKLKELGQDINPWISSNNFKPILERRQKEQNQDEQDQAKKEQDQAELEARVNKKVEDANTGPSLPTEDYLEFIGAEIDSPYGTMEDIDSEIAEQAGPDRVPASTEDRSLGDDPLTDIVEKFKSWSLIDGGDPTKLLLVGGKVYYDGDIIYDDESTSPVEQTLSSTTYGWVYISLDDEGDVTDVGNDFGSSLPDTTDEEVIIPLFYVPVTDGNPDLANMKIFHEGDVYYWSGEGDIEWPQSNRSRYMVLQINSNLSVSEEITTDDLIFDWVRAH